MFDFSSLLEFSHNHCIAICAFLVPANLLATIRTIVLVGLKRSQAQIGQALGLASVLALLMVLHVVSWFVIGVVMIPTFVLLWLGGVCLSVNLWAMLHPQSMRSLLLGLGRRLVNLRTSAASS